MLMIKFGNYTEEWVSHT